MSRIKFTAAATTKAKYDRKNGKRCWQLCGWSYMELQLPYGCFIEANRILRSLSSACDYKSQDLLVSINQIYKASYKLKEYAFKIKYRKYYVLF